MLLNVSYNDPKQELTITDLVGKPFNLRDRIKFSGVGSPKLQIVSSSPKIANLLLLDNNLDVCNIEIRPKGIIVRFRSLLETYAMVIPELSLKFNYNIPQNLETTNSCESLAPLCCETTTCLWSSNWFPLGRKRWLGFCWALQYQTALRSIMALVNFSSKVQATTHAWRISYTSACRLFAFAIYLVFFDDFVR